METFTRRTRIAAPAEEVFRWHARPGAFERLNLPWEPAAIVARHGGIEDGAVVVWRMSLGPLRHHGIAEHRDYQEGRQFRDVQVSGPFAHWVHTHRFEPDGPSGGDRRSSPRTLSIGVRCCFS
ncbi:MAG: SRPBCC family protein [Candidatus Binatia bacterium]